MSTLSRRGNALVESPALAPYIVAHFERRGDAWDPVHRPNGYVALCIAENKRMAPQLLALLSRYGDAPTTVLAYDEVVGNLAFRQNLASFLGRSSLGRKVDPGSLTVLAGAGSVLESLFYVLADRGDGVLVPTPSYAGFWPDLCTRNSLEIVPVSRRSEDDFRLTSALLDRALAAATVPVRALLFTTPDNPLGRVYTADEIEEVIEWTQRHGLHLVVDEIYALSTFGERPFVSAASLRHDLGEHIHIVWAFSKDLGASGLRCGVLLSENERVQRAISEISYWAGCSGHTQHLLSSLVADREAVDGYVAAMRADLGVACRRTMAQLDEHGIACLPAEAGFFLVCDLRPHLDAPTWQGERRLWRRILDGANVNLTPGEACRVAEPGFFRLCYAAEPQDAVDTAIGRVGALLRRPRAAR